MPKFRSISLSVVSQWEFRLHPEYPHPKSQKFMICSPASESKPYDKDEDDSEVPEYSYISGSEGTPQVSVYIPSCPGTRFWIRYAIAPDHPPAKLFYFKLYLNGRHISSWGVNPKKRPQGQIMRAFFNPEPEEGSQFKRRGIQARPFYFATESMSEASLDGGLIEIKCFRARGRRRRPPHPENFRGGQEKYGLNLPKGCLLDCPEDARFYDWLLVDPKDSPYASFRFHYRSWEHLVALSLIPPQHPRVLLTRTSSMWSVASDSPTRKENLARSVQPHKAIEDEEFFESHESQMAINHFEDSSLQLPEMETITNNLRENHVSRPLPVPGAQAVRSSNKAVSERPPTPFAMDFAGGRVPSGRLLPVPPNRYQPILHRVSSTVSTAHSITPSLHAYVDREKNSESPEPFIGVAAAVPVLYSSPNYVEESTIWDDALSQLSVESPARDSPGKHGSMRPSEPISYARAVLAAKSSTKYYDDSFLQDGLSQLSVESPVREPRFQSYEILRPASSARALPAPNASANYNPNYNEDSFIQDDGLSLLSVESPIRESQFRSYDILRPPSAARAAPAPSSPANYDEDSFVRDDDLSQLSVESPVREPQFQSYGILRPPEAMFSPASVAVLRQNREDHDYVPNVPATRMASFHSEMFKIRTDHDKSPEDRMKSYVSSRPEHEEFLEGDESTGLSGDDWLLRTPSPIQKKYEETHALHARNDDVYDTDARMVSTDSLNEDVDSEEGRDREERLSVPRSRSRMSFASWI